MNVRHSRRLCDAFELRGQVYEVWRTGAGRRFLVDPRTNHVVDLDSFDPPLTNNEMVSILEYGRA